MAKQTDNKSKELEANKASNSDALENGNAETNQPTKQEVEVVLNATQLRQLEANKLRKANALKAKKEAKILADKKADENSAIEKASKNPKKDNRKVYKDDKGQSFRFKKSAPKSLNIDGVKTSIDDIIEDEEIMLELVNGNSNFLEQIY